MAGGAQDSHFSRYALVEQASFFSHTLPSARLPDTFDETPG